METFTSAYSKSIHAVYQTGWLVTVLLVIPWLAWAEPAAIPNEQIFKPSPLPDRIILTPCGDPTEMMGLNWRTDLSITRGFAQIALAEVSRDFVDKAHQVASTTMVVETDNGPATFHSVRFASLSPGQTYAYRVGDGVNWSEWFQFRTASKRPEPFSFIYMGDSQTELKSLWSRVIRGAIVETSGVRFLLHAGDLINRSLRDVEWGEWFAAGAWINGTIPSLVAVGNHEYPRKEGTKESSLTPLWRPHFTLPEDGPEGLAETAYYFDYQGVRFVALNSNEKQEEQAVWLDQILSSNPNRWTIVTFHHPLFSSASKRDNPELRNKWQPVFDKYHVDLVLQGHDHSYARSGPLVYDNIPSGTAAICAPAGTVYVVSVSGPKLYPLERRDWMMRAGEGTQLYQVIRVDGDTLSYKAFTALGDLYDAFNLVKQGEGKPNRMEDYSLLPPERLPSASPGAAKPE